MKLTYKKIVIDNFKTIKHLEINCGNTTKIQGANETGKSTIADAISYCLFGKNSLGDTHFGILPNHSEMGVSPSVEIEVTADDKPINFKRTSHAEVNRQKEFTGKYKTICEVNGIDKGVKGFDKRLSEVVGSDIFKLLTNPFYFCEQMSTDKGELIWQRQRKMLFGISNCIADIDIINSEEKYAELSEPMQRFDTVGEYFKSVKSELSAISKRIDGFKDEVKQQNKNFVEITFDPNQLKANIEKVENDITNIVGKIADEKSNKAVMSLKNEMSALETSLASLKADNQKVIAKSQSDEMKKRKQQTSKDNQKLEEIQKSYEKDMESYREKKRKIEKEVYIESSNAGNAEVELHKLLNEYNKVSKTTPNIKEKCETCGRPFDEKSIAVAKEKFESDKKAKLVILKSDGEKARDEVNKLQSQLEVKKKALEDLKAPIVPKEVNALKSKIKETTDKPFENSDMPDFEKQLSKINSEIDGKKDEIQKAKDNSNINLEELEKNHLELKSTLKELQKNDKKISQNENSQREMDKLKSDHKERLKNKDMLTRSIDLISDFIKKKCDLSIEEVNSHFDFVKFKLFDYTKEGNLFECCVPTFNGIEYKDLSASTKIICGLDIIKAFQKFYESYLPIVIDNSETITDHIEMPCQLLIMKAVEENCPKCGGKTGRRDEDGLWTCGKCGYRWKKELKID